mgnify:CR=1 FL=1
MPDIIKAYQEVFNSYLKQEVRSSEPAGLYDPMCYILDLGGKRLRPVLTLITASAFGTDKEEALDAALAIEVFHNFTLVHDDIMDQDEVRRGQPTVHVKWDLGTAILAGDGIGPEIVEATLGVIDCLQRDFGFEAELERDRNKEVREMVITWEDALADSEARGIQTGEALVLKRQLGRRYGELPRWVEERLGKASREELESWADRVLDAKRLEDVFGSE